MIKPIAAALALLLFASHGQAQQERPSASRPVDQDQIRELARRVEPQLKGDPERLAQYVDFFRQAAVNDTRLFAFAVKAEPEGEHGARLQGYVEFPENRNAVAAYFAALGFSPIENQIRTLPARDLGEKRFGFVKASNSLSYMEANDNEVVTDCLVGEPLFLLAAENGYLWVHGGDGYLGYVAEDDVQRVTEKEFVQYLDGPRASIRSDHKLPSGLRLPAGARLKWIGEKGDSVAAQLPTGEKVTIPTSICEKRDVPRERIDLVCENAQQLLGTKYLWGGKTSDGVDCSGLVQVSFAGVGVTMPRDANQQFHVGQLTATRWARSGMRRGDTLYFINPQGRISHTGLYLGDDQFVQAVSPVVIINSFNSKDENYAPRQDQSFAYARRLWD